MFNREINRIEESMNSIIINEKDNVGVCLDGNDTIPAGHKYALCMIKKGEYVVKYGEIIGRATADIVEGEWVHTHNVKSHLDENVAYRYAFNANKPEKTTAFFKGYKREKGRAGIRNEIFIIPTVGCVNNVCIRLAKEAQSFITGSIDGVFALTHQFTVVVITIYHPSSVMTAIFRKTKKSGLKTSIRSHT